jgi:hypothetical protein
VSLTLPVEADLATNPHAADQPADAVAQNIRTVERFLDQSRLGEPGCNLADCSPFGTFDAVRVVPFGVFCDHDAALVGRDGARTSELFKFFLQLAAGVLVITSLSPLDLDGLHRQFHHFARRWSVLAEIPEAETIVAINGLDDIGLDVELDPHLAEVVTEQHADLAADGWIFDARGSRANMAPPFATKASSSA